MALAKLASTVWKQLSSLCTPRRKRHREEADLPEPEPLAPAEPTLTPRSAPKRVKMSRSPEFALPGTPQFQNPRPLPSRPRSGSGAVHTPPREPTPVLTPTPTRSRGNGALDFAVPANDTPANLLPASFSRARQVQATEVAEPTPPTSIPDEPSATPSYMGYLLDEPIRRRVLGLLPLVSADSRSQLEALLSPSPDGHGLAKRLTVDQYRLLVEPFAGWAQSQSFEDAVSVGRMFGEAMPRAPVAKPQPREQGAATVVSVGRMFGEAMPRAPVAKPQPREQGAATVVSEEEEEVESGSEAIDLVSDTDSSDIREQERDDAIARGELPSDIDERERETRWHPRRPWSPLPRPPSWSLATDRISAAASLARKRILRQTDAAAARSLAWSVEELAALAAMWDLEGDGDETDIVALVSDQTLSRSSLYAFLPGEWLTDQCMNVWVAYLRDVVAGRCGFISPRHRGSFHPHRLPPPKAPPLADLAPVCRAAIESATPSPLPGCPPELRSQRDLPMRRRFGFFPEPQAPPVGATRLGLIPLEDDAFGASKSSNGAALRAAAAGQELARATGKKCWPPRRKATQPRVFVAQIFHLWQLSLSESGYNYESVRRWVRRQGMDIRYLDLCLFPVNITPSHWAAVALDLRRKTVEYMDSLNTSRGPLKRGTRAHKVCSDVLRWVEDECREWPDVGGVIDTSEFRLVHSDRTPQQHNGYDCGVFAMWMVECLALDLRPTDVVSQRRIDHKRWKMIKLLTRYSPFFPEEHLGESSSSNDESDYPLVTATQAAEESLADEDVSEAEDTGFGEAVASDLDCRADADGETLPVDNMASVWEQAFRGGGEQGSGSNIDVITRLINDSMRDGSSSADPGALAELLLGSFDQDTTIQLASSLRQPQD
jgi:hypothetical protein